MSCHNQTLDEITKWVDLMKLQAGDTEPIRYRKHWHTDQPSIQGPWTPFMHRNPPNNLVTFPNEDLSVMLNKEQTATERLLEMVEEKQIQSKNE
jgi:large subunit ribosomal protein L43